MDKRPHGPVRELRESSLVIRMSAALTKDMSDFVAILEGHRVRYVVVGGIAVNYYGYVRTTQDIDVLIVPGKANAGRMMRALDEFGFGEAGIPAKAFLSTGAVVHLGVEPNRIDLLTSVKGISSEAVYRRKTRAVLGTKSVNLISFSDLLACKKASVRLKDLADVEELSRIAALQPSGKAGRQRRHRDRNDLPKPRVRHAAS